jgi:hypothetical protein
LFLRILASDIGAGFNGHGSASLNPFCLINQKAPARTFPCFSFMRGVFFSNPAWIFHFKVRRNFPLDRFSDLLAYSLVPGVVGSIRHSGQQAFKCSNEVGFAENQPGAINPEDLS